MKRKTKSDLVTGDGDINGNMNMIINNVGINGVESGAAASENVTVPQM